MTKHRIVRREADLAKTDLPDDLHPVLRRVYAARGVTNPDEIDHRLGHMLSPMALGGMGLACALLETAIREDARIVIVGDFDCDGATGTAVAVRGLRLLGARHVEFAVPNRMRHGYGLSPALLDELLPQRPQLLVTVDNGIAAHAGIAAAREQGIAVIVTDHHLPGTTLPPADAIVNPNLIDVDGCAHAAGDSICSDCSEQIRLNRNFPSRALAGVGVMFYLLLALRARMFPGKSGQEDRKTTALRPDLSALLDLVAIGTVADLVPLDRNNRILVQAGLKRIRAGRCCVGVKALLSAGKVDRKRISAADLGFRVAPRINAAGRLDDMRLGIVCLLTDDQARAHEYACMLDSINIERRQVQVDMLEQAEALVRKWRDQNVQSEMPHGVVLFDDQWHPGVVGLVASKLRETLNRPVIACAPGMATSGLAADGGIAADAEIKASGRSVTGFHLRDALAEVDARHPGLIQRFGGHAMAAGLSFKRDSLAEFAAAFDKVVRERIAPESLQAVIFSDGTLKAEDFRLDLAQCLRQAGPWGQAFPEPAFDDQFEIVDWKVVGETHLRMTLRHPDAPQPLPAMMFGGYAGQKPPQHVRVVFHLDVNEWKGTRSLQLLVRHLQPV